MFLTIKCIFSPKSRNAEHIGLRTCVIQNWIQGANAGGSGVATGWHGWTMSMGPGAKGAPRERQKKKEEENRKEKKGKRKK